MRSLASIRLNRLVSAVMLTLVASLVLDVDRVTATPRLKHVWVVVLENHSTGQILGNRNAPYLNLLARHHGLASRYYSIRHPSLPNYLALISGSTQGCRSDRCRPGYRGPTLGATAAKPRPHLAGVLPGTAARRVRGGRPRTVHSPPQSVCVLLEHHPLPGPPKPSPPGAADARPPPPTGIQPGDTRQPAQHARWQRQEFGSLAARVDSQDHAIARVPPGRRHLHHVRRRAARFDRVLYAWNPRRPHAADRDHSSPPACDAAPSPHCVLTSAHDRERLSACTAGPGSTGGAVERVLALAGLNPAPRCPRW